MINWKVRIRNKAFWVAFIPAVLLLIQNAAAVFGYTLDFSGMEPRLLAAVESVFMVLALLGIINDPTTAGISDSGLAMTYSRPKVDIEFEEYD